MNILFLSLIDILSLEDRGIYPELLKELAERGHHIYCISPVERRKKEATRLIKQNNASILRLKIGNIQKTNIIEKGINTLLIELRVVWAIKRYFSKIKFDLVLYPTPPITFDKAVRYVKKRDNASSYLMLKDIFPQNAVDLGMIKENGLLHRFFLRKEKRLYQGADYIGCMSRANVRYLLTHNSQIDAGKIEICPNSSAPKLFARCDGHAFRKNYSIPKNAVVFLYGGNLGKPQDIGFICKCLEQNLNREDRFFIICGDGTEYNHLKNFIDLQKPSNIVLLRGLPQTEYAAIATCCDVGLIFLDHRFTIPNFPSRLLSYMENSMPVLACTDKASDIGQVVVEGGFGWWCESLDVNEVTSLINNVISLKPDLHRFGKAAREYLEQYYTASKSADIILKHFTKPDHDFGES